MTLAGNLTSVAVDERQRHVLVTNAGTTDRSGTWATLDLHVLDAQSACAPAVGLLLSRPRGAPPRCPWGTRCDLLQGPRGLWGGYRPDRSVRRWRVTSQ